MTIIDIFDTFTFYGADVVLLSVATAALVQICKRTFLKNIRKKFLTFLPFVVGTLLYALYAAARHQDFFYLFKNHSDLLEHGFSVGTLATLVYVLYEQFVRSNGNLSAAEEVVRALIGGYVPTETEVETAKQIVRAIEQDDAGDGAEKAAEILAENSVEGVSERDVELLAKLIFETLTRLSAD